MKYLLYLFTVFCLLSSVTLFAGGGLGYPELSDGEKKQFYERLQGEIAKTNAEFLKLTEQIGKAGPLDLKSVRLRLEKTSAQLMTKQILFENFYETPSIQSPQVREELIHIFSRQEITAFDLTRLENLVAREKPKILEKKGL